MIRCLSFVLLLGAALARADSPLTSTDFATAYGDVPAVKAAKEGKTDLAYAFLTSQAPNDQKLAVANALGWEGDFATGYFVSLARARDVKEAELDVKNLSASELFVAGYLVAMADYLDLKPLKPGARGVWGKTGQFLLDRAAGSLREDFTVQYVQALVKAQKAMAGPWCEVFRIPNDVLKRFPPARRNLRPGARRVSAGLPGRLRRIVPRLEGRQPRRAGVVEPALHALAGWGRSSSPARRAAWWCGAPRRSSRWRSGPASSARA